MCRADSSLIFCSKYNDAAKKVADSVLNNKPADPDSQQSSKPSSKSGAAAGSVSLVLSGFAAAVAILML